MRLAGTRYRFSAYDRLTAGQGQQVAFLCGLENIASLYRHLIARLQILKVDGCEVITVHRHIYRAMSYQTIEQTANLSGPQHVVEDLTEDGRLSAQIAHP